LKEVRSAVALLRIRQWVKNGFVLPPLFFGSEIGHTSAVRRAACAFVVFCLFSSAVYIFNDWRDIEADRQHAKTPCDSSPRAGCPLRWRSRSWPHCSWRLRRPSRSRPSPKALPSPSPSISRSTFGYSLGIKHVSVIELVLGDSGMLATSSSSQWPSHI